MSSRIFGNLQGLLGLRSRQPAKRRGRNPRGFPDGRPFRLEPLEHRLLLGTRQDMDDIAAAIAKIQAATPLSPSPTETES